MFFRNLWLQGSGRTQMGIILYFYFWLEIILQHVYCIPIIFYHSFPAQASSSQLQTINQLLSINQFIHFYDSTLNQSLILIPMGENIFIVFSHLILNNYLYIHIYLHVYICLLKFLSFFLKTENVFWKEDTK